MFTKDHKKYNEAERAYWAHTKAQGKRRFIVREMAFNIILWLGITGVLPFTDRPVRTPRSVASMAVVMLPIFMLGGYLSAKWKWSDFEKKYPE